MNAREVMSSPVSTISPLATVAEVAQKMLEQRVSGLPVVDDRGTILGMVTKTDLVAKHAQVHLPKYFGFLGAVLPFETRHSDEDMRHVLAVTAGDLMTEKPPTVSPDTSIDVVATLMVEHGTSPVPVVEDGRLVGIVGRDDIIRVLLLEERDVESGSSDV